MNIRTCIVACVIALPSLPIQAQMKATRSSALAGAKDLTVTIGSTVHYYMVSSNDKQVIRLTDGNININGDTYDKSKAKLRFRTIPHLLMDEDSVTFDKTATLEHAVVALRRNFAVNQWNSIVLPYDLTGKQLRDAFGNDMKLATMDGINEDDPSIVEFSTLDVTSNEVVLSANHHYLIYPTKEPDVAASSSLSNFYRSSIKGPLYLIPEVYMKKNQSPLYQTIKNSDQSTQVRFRGTYNALDATNVSGRTVKNKKVEPGTYTLDEERQAFVFHEDSVIVKAFRSWAKDISNEPKALKFCIDGVELADGIEKVNMDDPQWTIHDDAVYDLSGRQMPNPKWPDGTLRKGIYIVNGRKVVFK